MKTEYTFWEYNTSMIKDVFEWFSAVKHVFCRAGNQFSNLNIHDIKIKYIEQSVSINSWQSIVVESDATSITGMPLINSKLHQNNLVWTFQIPGLLCLIINAYKFFMMNIVITEWTFI